MTSMVNRKDVGAAAGRPLYLQLVDWLRADAAGRKPGSRIDSEPQLARRFGVSRFTVTRAIEILVDEGLFTRRQGLGTFVAPPRLRRAPNYLSSFTDTIVAQGRTPSHRLLAFRVVERPDQPTASPYPETTRLLLLDRLRLVDDAPTAIHRSVLDAAFAERIGLTKAVAAEPGFSLYRLFRERGLEIDRGVETLQARRATPKEARLLGLDADRVVIRVRRETYGTDGSLLDSDDAIYDARRYTLESELRRGGESPTPYVSTLTEKVHASNSNDIRSFGARFGPWSDLGGCG